MQWFIKFLWMALPFTSLQILLESHTVPLSVVYFHLGRVPPVFSQLTLAICEEACKFIPFGNPLTVLPLKAVHLRLGRSWSRSVGFSSIGSASERCDCYERENPHFIIADFTIIRIMRIYKFKLKIADCCS